MKTMNRNAHAVSEILRALAHPMRLVIVCALLERERCAMELLAITGTTKGNISQHLKLLVLKQFLHKRKDGNRVYYRIADMKLRNIIGCLSKCYCKHI